MKESFVNWIFLHKKKKPSPHTYLFKVPLLNKSIPILKKKKLNKKKENLK